MFVCCHLPSVLYVFFKPGVPGAVPGVRAEWQAGRHVDGDGATAAPQSHDGGPQRFRQVHHAWQVRQLSNLFTGIYLFHHFSTLFLTYSEAQSPLIWKVYTKH